MCVRATCTVSLRNVSELLEFADMYNATQLKTTCQQFITINLPALLESRLPTHCCVWCLPLFLKIPSFLSSLSRNACKLIALYSFYRSVMPVLDARNGYIRNVVV